MTRRCIPGPYVAVDARQSLLTLAIHELATNAVKYGALFNGTGHVRIDWTVLDDHVRLLWQESGAPPVRSPQKTGFGSLLINQVLDGEGRAAIDFAPDGVICTLHIALARPEQSPALGTA